MGKYSYIYFCFHLSLLMLRQQHDDLDVPRNTYSIIIIKNSNLLYVCHKYTYVYK